MANERPIQKRVSGRMKAILAAMLLSTSCAHAADVSGVPRIVDGDTIQIGVTKIRLNGIDAPETDQLCLDAKGDRWACGVAARDELIKFSHDRSWTCDVTGLDKYGRSLADCKIDGVDVDRWMVRSGWALAFVRYSREYVADELDARSNRSGLWSGAFIAPWDWRGHNKQTEILGSGSVPVNAQTVLLSAVSAGQAADQACTIKGNRNRSGECIYHEPGGRWYAKVNMDLSRGKRWFCSAAEAEAAGCRPAKN
jgi:endonuclease YncB( thermonuclease family)